eukprot:g37348.t1
MEYLDAEVKEDFHMGARLPCQDKTATGTRSPPQETNAQRYRHAGPRPPFSSFRHLGLAVDLVPRHTLKDIVKLENVRRRFTRMLPGLVGLSYGDRLSRIRLHSLEHKRMRGDLIE